MSLNKLSLKQTAFIDQLFTNSFNASEAYRIAYPNCKAGHNKLSSRLMANDGIKEEISRRMADKIAKEAEEAKEHDLTIAWLRTLHLAEYERLKDTDKTNARQHLEAAGKTIAAYIDRHRDESTAQPQPLTDAEVEELKAYAAHATRMRQQQAREGDGLN